MGTACPMRGSPQVFDQLETKLGIKAGQTLRVTLMVRAQVGCHQVNRPNYQEYFACRGYGMEKLRSVSVLDSRCSG